MNVFLLLIVTAAFLVFRVGHTAKTDVTEGTELQNSKKNDSRPPGREPELSIQRDDSALLPFWKSKPAVYKRIVEERSVIVSVKSEDWAGKTRFTISGAGLVRIPKDYAFRVAQQYPKLKEVSEHFKTVTYVPEKRELFLITEAMGYQARMLLTMTPVAQDWRSELQWEVIWGAFQGMKGIVGFEVYQGSHTEVSFWAEYISEKIPLPKILMGFALEVITQKVAEKMRTYLEREYSSREGKG